MSLKSLFLSLIIVSFSVKGFCQGFPEGIWLVTGENSQLGKYTGELEIRKVADAYQVIRLIQYQDFRYQQFKVQSVWTGGLLNASLDNLEQGLTMNFLLKESNFLSKFRGLNSRYREIPVRILFQKDQGSNVLRAKFGLPGEGNNFESLTFSRALAQMPLWKKQSFARIINPNMSAARRADYDKYFSSYQNDPFISQYSQRPEYQVGQMSMLTDHTDLDFYQKNPQFLRVSNRILSDLSLEEEAIRNSALSPRLIDKANFFQEQTQNYNINQFGFVSYAQFSGQRFVKFIPDGDSLLWTGFYLASQALRYQKTKLPQALDNMKKSLKGLFLAMDITQDPKQFARTVHLLSEVAEDGKLSEPWAQGTGPYAHLAYIKGGNNDMLKGLLLGFTISEKVLAGAPDAENLRGQIKSYSARLLDLDVVQQKKQNQSAPRGLIALLEGKWKDKIKYLAKYQTAARVVLEIPTLDNIEEKLLDIGAVDWSGVNLGQASLIPEIIIAERNGAGDLRKAFSEKLTNFWQKYSAFDRHLLTLTTNYFAQDIPKPESFTQALRAAEFYLQSFPTRLPDSNFEIEHQLKPEWVASPFPRLPWKYLGEIKPKPEDTYQGIYAYPLYELAIWGSDNVFKDAPFLFKKQIDVSFRPPRIDFLFAYYLL